MIKRHPPHCPLILGNPPSRCARQRNTGFTHSLKDCRVGTQGRRIDLTFMSLRADFLSLLASATWAIANRRDVYGCMFRRKTRPRRRAEYHANRRSCAVWLIDSSKIGVLARLIGVSVKPDRRDVKSQAWLFDSVQPHAPGPLMWEGACSR